MPENELHNTALLTATESISKLPTFDSENVETFEQYKNFVDKVNDSVWILNRELELESDIPRLQNTQEEFNKISNAITKYTPLINSYNNMIYAANNIDTSDQKSISCFYTRTAIFSVEVTLISTSFYAGTTYKVVGDIYRASGLQSLAFKCSSCVATALSNAHWFFRTHLVHGTSVAAIGTIEGIEELFLENFPNP